MRPLMPSILLLESSGRARRQILDTAARDATHMIVISHIGVKPFLAAGALKFPRHARPTSSRGPDQRQEANRHSSALQGLSVVGGSLGVYPSVNYVASCVALRIVTIPNILVRTCSVNPPLDYSGPEIPDRRLRRTRGLGNWRLVRKGARRSSASMPMHSDSVLRAGSANARTSHY